MRILHLSDIQDGELGIKPDLKDKFPDDWEEKYKDILEDLKSEFNSIHSKTPIDIITISGDLASTEFEEEYKNLSKEFVPILEEIFLKGSNPVPKDRWLIIPGNHDVQSDEGIERFDEFIKFCEGNGFKLPYE